MAEEKGLRVDIGEYERLMEEARERARAAGKFGALSVEIAPEFVQGLGPTDESAKYTTRQLDATLLAAIRIDVDPSEMHMFAQPNVVWDISAGDRVAMIFDRTCLYAEAGGQVGDSGEAHGDNVAVKISDTQRVGDVVVHFGNLRSGTLSGGDTLTMTAHERRALTNKNHTATHVLNWALREVLGEHIQQKGSLVDDEKTRFDFSHPKALNDAEIAKVEQLVNKQIAAKLTVYDRVVPQEEALKINGLRAVFGEKYPEEVRVMSIGKPVDELLAQPDNADWRKLSIEFCGGTHVANTSEIEDFALVAEEAVAKGVTARGRRHGRRRPRSPLDR